MNEITYTTQKMAGSYAEGWHIWGWEVPVYLFLGGITAGIIILAALMILKKRGKDLPVSTNRVILWAPLFLTLGMGALFLDLANKQNVISFYLTFKITSVMSWGSWILLLIYPISILLILATFREGYPELYVKITEKLTPVLNGKPAKLLESMISFSERNRDLIAKFAIPSGIALGIYTGILLSAFNAHPLWNSAILGPLFLVSGISTGAAFIILLSEKEERHFISSIDTKLIITEISILGLYFIGQITGGASKSEAINVFLGGSIITPVFWIFVVFAGLLLPLFLEWQEQRGIEVHPKLQPALVLFGGVMLRIILVKAAFTIRDTNIHKLLY